MADPLIQRVRYITDCEGSNLTNPQTAQDQGRANEHESSSGTQQ
jgi:hypothetical protein